MLYAMAATTLAGLATALGGALGALRRPGRQGMAFAMGFGAGVMLAVSLMDMLPGALGRYLAAFAPLRAGAMAASLVLLGLAAGAQNFWVFCKERLDRSKKEKNHRVGFNSHQ